MYQASEVLGIDLRNLSAVVNGRRSSCYGYSFSYLNPTEEDLNRIKTNTEKRKLDKNLKENINHSKMKKLKYVKVRCIETGEVFESQSQASAKYNVDPDSLSCVICGKYKTAGGFHWEKVE